MRYRGLRRFDKYVGVMRISNTETASKVKSEKGKLNTGIANEVKLEDVESEGSQIEQRKPEN